MEKGNISEIKMKLESALNTIFYNYNLNELSEYEKRRIVFTYLCENLAYDYLLLKEIKDSNEGKKRIIRNPYYELLDVFDNHKGICNAISQYYKLLLEKLGIKSYCVICDDGTSVNHQLNLVYDTLNNSFSFDDVTSVIVNRGTIDEYFDYNLEFANSVNQGNKVILDNEKWVILPEEYVNYLIGREFSIFPTIENLPNNIRAIKQTQTYK